jgi:hypothetical protein
MYTDRGSFCHARKFFSHLTGCWKPEAREKLVALLKEERELRKNKLLEVK